MHGSSPARLKSRGDAALHPHAPAAMAREAGRRAGSALDRVLDRRDLRKRVALAVLATPSLVHLRTAECEYEANRTLPRKAIRKSVYDNSV